MQFKSRAGEQRRQIINIVSTGKPAIFVHQTEEASQRIVAEANTIDYHLKNATIILRDKASLLQQGSSVSGDLIEYFIQEQRVKAQAKTEDDNSRVRTIISPDAGNPFETATDN